MLLILHLLAWFWYERPITEVPAALSLDNLRLKRRRGETLRIAFKSLHLFSLLQEGTLPLFFSARQALVEKGRFCAMRFNFNRIYCLVERANFARVSTRLCASQTALAAYFRPTACTSRSCGSSFLGYPIEFVGYLCDVLRNLRLLSPSDRDSTRLSPLFCVA